MLPLFQKTGVCLFRGLWSQWDNGEDVKGSVYHCLEEQRLTAHCSLDHSLYDGKRLTADPELFQKNLGFLCTSTTSMIG